MERKEILERLVALHGERVAEESVGKVRWLRPEDQIPWYAPGSVSAGLELEVAGVGGGGLSASPPASSPGLLPPWSSSAR